MKKLAFVMVVLSAALGRVEGQGMGGPPRSNSLADQADAVEASLGLVPMSVRYAAEGRGGYGGGYGGWSYGGVGVQPGVSSLYGPGRYYRPFRARTSYPPLGPSRMLRGPGGELTPEYLVPRGHRDSYRFAGWR